MQNKARQLCPVDTGALRRSITFSITGTSAATLRARVGSNLEYALAVETGHGEIRPVRARVLRFPVRGGGIVYTNYVRPVAARPYLRPALAAVA